MFFLNQLVSCSNGFRKALNGLQTLRVEENVGMGCMNNKPGWSLSVIVQVVCQYRMRI